MRRIGYTRWPAWPVCIGKLFPFLNDCLVDYKARVACLLHAATEALLVQIFFLNVFFLIFLLRTQAWLNILYLHKLFLYNL